MLDESATGFHSVLHHSLTITGYIPGEPLSTAGGALGPPEHCLRWIKGETGKQKKEAPLHQ